jgi:hypothetical protein
MKRTRGITKSGGQKDVFDKFYTKPEIAKYFIAKSDVASFTAIIEPSAGNGAFSNQIENCIALDLKPEAVGIEEQDWLAYVHPTKKKEERVLVIGNPPFGQQNNLAIGFINHAVKFADRVAFILPISFKKDSLHDRIDSSMHLVYEEDVPKDSFTFNGIDYDVKCVFQIWDKKEELRTKQDRANLNSNNLFGYVKKIDSPDAVIQRIGGKAGKAYSLRSGEITTASNYAQNYFIKFKNPLTLPELDTVIKQLNDISYPSMNHAVGPRSISKREVNQEINKRFEV